MSWPSLYYWHNFKLLLVFLFYEELYLPQSRTHFFIIENTMKKMRYMFIIAVQGYYEITTSLSTSTPWIRTIIRRQQIRFFRLRMKLQYRLKCSPYFEYIWRGVFHNHPATTVKISRPCLYFLISYDYHRHRHTHTHITFCLYVYTVCTLTSRAMWRDAMWKEFYVEYCRMSGTELFPLKVPSLRRLVLLIRVVFKMTMRISIEHLWHVAERTAGKY